MKDVIINFLCERLQKRKESRPSKPYDTATKTGVIINGDLTWKGLDRFITALTEDHKDISVMTFKSDKKLLNDKTSFSPSDIGFFGKFNSALLESFVEAKFDYLYVLDKQSNVFIKYVGLLTNAETTVGFYHEEGNYLADLQLKPNSGTELEELLKYSRQLS